jgi:hypothetical protein
LDVCRMDQHTQHQPNRINEQCTLTTLDLFFPRRSRVRRPTRWF